MSSKIENVDMFSSLPEEILSHILSLMPTKYAVRTSILSKRWRYSWMFVTNFDFDGTRTNPFHGLDRFTKFVDRVLNDCKTSKINLFRLQFYETCVQKLSASSWIDKAVRLNVCELDIRSIQLELPLSLFTCKTLTKLRLERWACDGKDWGCPSSVNLPCLKTLDVVVHSDPFVNAFKLIGGCPMLESLSLEVTRRKKFAGCYIFNIPTLKRLKLTFALVITSDINKVVLRVPNLEYLFLGGVLCSLFQMEDVSSLVEVSVSLRHIAYDYLWVELLNGVSGVKSLLTQDIPSSFLLPIFPNMNRLELGMFWHYRQILQFLESCPALRHLYIEKSGKSHWIEPEVVPACLLTNLKTVKFSKCKGYKRDLHFLEYILWYAEVLEIVTVTWENLCMEKERELCLWLLELPRASKYCEIHFIGD
ncbi:putative F-box domain, FBD domain, leucine-rich repeat domain superfamily [Helianthus annuus]|uniref:F-box domain, FBD domain, leucine-rich repeat domain superfamily n=1 Tax=Helianthus annuus TaxID=4232 RepID=A0A9K3GWV8_HELAN|nr:putative F-box domain, FBD domain, leucine-rich repeat domain superfamily [Helianthus annuus]KAJ0430563.1 putative F-box domain, FBD domain, leucine-rich repeat domain superfamily [Helianthus annuus]